MNRYSNNWHVKRGFVQDLSLIGRILILLPWPDLYIKCINTLFMVLTQAVADKLQDLRERLICLIWFDSIPGPVPNKENAKHGILTPIHLSWEVWGLLTFFNTCEW